MQVHELPRPDILQPNCDARIRANGPSEKKNGTIKVDTKTMKHTAWYPGIGELWSQRPQICPDNLAGKGCVLSPRPESRTKADVRRCR